MNVQAFIDKWNGKAADYDGVFGAQCVDLFNYYNRDVVGGGWIGTPRTGGARDLWECDSTERDKHYTKVRANATPQTGDVAVWSGSVPGSHGYGHVAIVVSVAGDVFTSFDQNWGVQHCRFVNHNRSHLLGFLRPKKFAQQPEKSPGKALSKKRYVYLPEVPAWRTYALNVQPVTKNSDWSISPATHPEARKYEVLGNPYPNVVTIKTQMRGKRNIYVGKETGAIIK